MKKILKSLTLFCCTLFALVTVNAATKEEVDLKELKNDSMIIGHRIYDTNYLISLYDIVSASSEYAVETGEMAPIYVYVVDSSNPDNNYIIEYTGPADETGQVPRRKIDDVESIYPDSKIEATTINNTPTYDYVANDIEPQVRAAVEELNENAADRGFESITYANKTVTFTIADLKRDLASYKDSGIVDMFLTIIEEGKKVKYNLGAEKEVDLTDLANNEVIALAYEVLAYLAGDAEELTYGAVANKSISATVTFEYEGFEYEETYTLSFVYDVEEVKDEALANVATELNKEAAKYGFESIAYDAETKTATFTIADLKASLADYQNSGIVNYFLENVKGASKAVYNLGTEKEVNLTELTNNEVIALAYEVLAYLAGDAEELTLGAVANKSVSAVITYVVGGEEVPVTYTLSFVYDVEEVKDEALESVATELNKEAAKYGFESIAYDAETKTATFTIADLKASLADYQNSGVVDFFLKNIEGASKAVYNLGTAKEVDLTKLTNNEVIALAYEVLAYLAGDAEELTLGAVANKSVSAVITYVVGGEEVPVTYTLSFVYDVEEVKDEALANVATELNKEAAKYGFESIAYDAETKTATFTIADPDASLASYKNSGIVNYFLENVKGASKAVYNLGTEKEVDLTKLTNNEVIALAYELLAHLAGDAEELTLGSVAGESVSAVITYAVGGEEVPVTYTLSFVMGE